MSEYIPSPRDWVAKQVALYEGSGGTKGLTLRDTGLPVIIVTNTGRRTGAIRKTPLMRAVDGQNYVLVASQGGAPRHPQWYFNLKAEPHVEVRDKTVVRRMRVREITEPGERKRLSKFWGRPHSRPLVWWPQVKPHPPRCRRLRPSQASTSATRRRDSA
jgi:deazaflavin-dependent oxidoreductase (nitroreductase family)